MYKRTVSGVYKKLVGVLYALNIVAQAVVTLIIPAGAMFLLSWLLSEKCGVGKWIYAVLITAGVISGFISMIRFVIRAAEAAQRLGEDDKNNKNGS